MSQTHETQFSTTHVKVNYETKTNPNKTHAENQEVLVWSPGSCNPSDNRWQYTLYIMADNVSGCKLNTEHYQVFLQITQSHIYLVVISDVVIT